MDKAWDHGGKTLVKLVGAFIWLVHYLKIPKFEKVRQVGNK